MQIHEYQAKALFSSHQVSIPNGIMADTPQKARAAAEKIGGSRWVVKAQVHAGGRGKGGGIRVVDGLDAVEQTTQDMLGMCLVTPQTGAEGKTVRKVLIEEGMDIAREWYIALMVNRNEQRVMLLASTEGGMDIETVSENSPEKIVHEIVDPTVGLLSFQALRIALTLAGDCDVKIQRTISQLVSNLYRFFMDNDCAMVEINPLILTKDNRVLALDAKVEFDDSGLFRHQPLLALRDQEEEDPLEVEAEAADLNYIKLEGNIGCMVNGAGLAMGTMDLIKHTGGMPANFLDVGGTADQKRVAAAFRIICTDPAVRCILINIFGGIVRCDTVAEGIVAAFREVNPTIPVVVRLEGTNAELAKKILADAGLAGRLIMADSLTEAAEKSLAAL